MSPPSLICQYLLCLTSNVVFFQVPRWKRVSNNIIKHLSFHPADNPAWFPRSYATLTLTASVFFPNVTAFHCWTLCSCAAASANDRRVRPAVLVFMAFLLCLRRFSLSNCRCGGREEQRVSDLSGWDWSGAFLPESPQNISFPQITVLAGWLAGRSQCDGRGGPSWTNSR